MTSHEVLARLADDPTEAQLSELANGSTTWVSDPLNDLNAIGHAVVPCDDGLLLIPYTAVRLGEGWEQLDLVHAQRIAEPLAYQNAARDYRVALEHLIAVLNDALAKKEEPTAL